MAEEKYVVFKKEQFDRWVEIGDIAVDETIMLDDACVLRLQDPFAEAGLRGYASALMAAEETLIILGYPSLTMRTHLQEKIEWALQQADEASSRKRHEVPS